MTSNEREKRIYDALIASGMTPAGASGTMGNLYAESGLNPRNLQNTFEKSLGYSDDAYTVAVDSGSYTRFATDSVGYGLAQWTYRTRKQNLLDFARSRYVSIGDLDMQLAFLVQELKTGYAALFRLLCSTSDVQAASDAFLTQFERPADQGPSVKAKRGSYAKIYFDRYGTAAPVPPNDKEGEIDMTITEAQLKKLIKETVEEVLNEQNPVIKDYKDCPAYFQPEARKLLDSEAINGGTSKAANANDMNVRLETLKAAVIAVRACDSRHSG